MDMVIYHGDGCLDGFTAAWVLHSKFPRAEFVPAVHRDAPPDVRGKDVLVVDFSYPRDVTEDLKAQANSFFVLDHHKTAAQNLDGLTYTYFDMGRSGAGLAWDYANPGQGRPDIVKLVEDGDLHRFTYPATKPYVAALGTYTMTFDVWDKISATPTDVLVKKGEVIQESLRALARKLAERGGILHLPCGQPVWCANAAPEILSYVASYVAKEKLLPALSWHWDSARGDCYCSLRSPESPHDIDAATIAESFGGGGHRGAAGFRLAAPPPALWN